MDIKRAALKLLNSKMEMASALAILGPRQVGKTTLAKQYAKSQGREFIYLDLESLQDMSKLGDDPETFFEYHQDKLIILDEVQSRPQLFSLLRSTVDRNRVAGDSASLITYVTDRAGHDLRYAIDATKIKRELGWMPSVTFQEGLAKTVDWYLANDEWMKQVTSGAYLSYY